MSSLKSFLTNNLSLLIMASYRTGLQVEKFELRNPTSFLVSYLRIELHPFLLLKLALMIFNILLK